MQNINTAKAFSDKKLKVGCEAKSQQFVTEIIIVEIDANLQTYIKQVVLEQ